MKRRGMIGLFFVVLAGACGRKGAPPLASSSLWALAPPSADFAVVVRDGALPQLLRGVRVLATKTDPAVAAEIRNELRRLPVDVLDDASLKAAGVDAGLGLAIFGMGGRTVIVAPVSDGTKLREKLGARWSCRQVHGRVACADDEAALAKVGTSAALADEIKKESLEMRGDIEAYVASVPGVLPIDHPHGAWITAQLAPGAVTVRAIVPGKPLLPPIPAMTLTSGLAEQRPSGLTLAHAGPWMASFTPPNVMLPGGVGSRELFAAFTGELVAWSASGAPARGVAKLGVKDPAVLRRLLDACDALSREPMIVAHKEGDRCQITAKVPRFPQPISVTAWLEEGALALGFGGYKTGGSRQDASPFVGEILEGKWAAAAWGRGLFAMLLPYTVAELGEGNAAAMKPQMSLLLHLTELGIGVGWDDAGYHALLRIGTTYANSDEVVAALEPLLGRVLDGDSAAIADIQALAKKNPGSPLAEVVDSGPAGMIAGISVVGAIGAVALPAFMKNARKTKTVEATVMVKRLSDGARAYYEEGGHRRFPGPSASATPAATCCGHPGDKCAPDPSLWAKEPWKSLKFSMDDPHYYRYEYEVAGDGQTFTARALGDLDCDGDYSTFETVGSVAADGTVTSPGFFVNKELE